MLSVMDITKNEFGNLELSVPLKSDRLEILYALEDYSELVIWHDLLEPYYTNGRFFPINPEDIGALTSDPYLLAEDYSGETGDIWHYPDYALHSIVEKIANGETVVLHYIPDEKSHRLPIITIKEERLGHFIPKQRLPEEINAHV